jgi:hypothetical protein
MMSMTSNCSEMSRSSSENTESSTKNQHQRELISTSNSLLEQLKKGAMQLKKIENKPDINQRQIPLKKDEEKILQTSLTQAIKLRRTELTKNDVESDGSDSDWSD